MKSLILIAALSACSPTLAAFVPVHGCEWVPEVTAISNFTFFDGISNSDAPDYVRWQAPAIGVACSASGSSTSVIGTPGTSTPVTCAQSASSNTQGSFFVAATSEADVEGARNTTLQFKVYEQCAASIWAFYYEANVLLACAGGDDGSAETCVPAGNATARVTGQQWLPPTSNPPPPPPQW